MTEALSKEKLVELEAKHPVVMSKQEKLLHWASLIRQHPGSLMLYHNLEYQSRRELDNPRYAFDPKEVSTAFSIAADDPQFKAAGLRDHTPGASMDFFELNQRELHEFSCDCGGHISNEQQAQRIERIANGGAHFNPSISRAYDYVVMQSRFFDEPTRR